MGAAPLTLFCFPTHEKREMEIVIGDAREIRSKEVKSKWLNAGVLK